MMTSTPHISEAQAKWWQVHRIGAYRRDPTDGRKLIDDSDDKSFDTLREARGWCDANPRNRDLAAELLESLQL